MLPTILNLLSLAAVPLVTAANLNDLLPLLGADPAGTRGPFSCVFAVVAEPGNRLLIDVFDPKGTRLTDYKSGEAIANASSSDLRSTGYVNTTGSAEIYYGVTGVDDNGIGDVGFSYNWKLQDTVFAALVNTTEACTPFTEGIPDGVFAKQCLFDC